MERERAKHARNSSPRRGRGPVHTLLRYAWVSIRVAARFIAKSHESDSATAAAGGRGYGALLPGVRALRRRTDSKRQIPALTETLRLSTSPPMGMRTRRSQFSRVWRRMHSSPAPRATARAPALMAAAAVEAIEPLRRHAHQAHAGALGRHGEILAARVVPRLVEEDLQHRLRIGAQPREDGVKTKDHAGFALSGHRLNRA